MSGLERPFVIARRCTPDFGSRLIAAGRLMIRLGQV
jgi:hypothetical protein